MGGQADVTFRSETCMVYGFLREEQWRKLAGYTSCVTATEARSPPSYHFRLGLCANKTPIVDTCFTNTACLRDLCGFSTSRSRAFGARTACACVREVCLFAHLCVNFGRSDCTCNWDIVRTFVCVSLSSWTSVWTWPERREIAWLSLEQEHLE